MIKWDSGINVVNYLQDICLFECKQNAIFSQTTVKL